MKNCKTCRLAPGKSVFVDDVKKPKCLSCNRSLFEVSKISVGIRWWEKTLLLFCKPHYGHDWGFEDKTVIIKVKQLFGKYYLLE